MLKLNNLLILLFLGAALTGYFFVFETTRSSDPSKALIGFTRNKTETPSDKVARVGTRKTLSIHKSGTGIVFVDKNSGEIIKHSALEGGESVLGRHANLVDMTGEESNIVGLFSSENGLAYRYLEKTGRSFQDIDTDIQAATVGHLGEIFYFKKKDTSGEIRSFDPRTGAGESLLLSRANIVTLSEINSGLLVKLLNPHGLLDVYRLDGKNFEKIIEAVDGSAGVVSPDNSRYLFSRAKEGEGSLFLFESGRTIPLGLNTSSDRCTWLDNIRLACGVSQSSISDSVYLLDTETGESSKLLSFDGVMKIKNPITSGGYFYFINRFDERVYYLNLNYN